MTPARQLAGWLLLALALSCGQVQAQSPKAWAYLGWWLPQSWRTAPLAEIERLLFFEIKIADNGDLADLHGWPEEWGDLQEALSSNGTALDLTLTLFEPKAFNQLFSSPSAVRRLTERALALAEQDGVAGLHLDVEIYTAVEPAAIARYRSFVRALAARLHQKTPAKNLSVFFPIGGVSALYDATTLAHLDQVVLQGYDAHWQGSKTAGPVAPLAGEERVTWDKALALARRLGLAPNRLLLGFPLYGYEWPVQGRTPRSLTTGKGVSTSFAPLSDDYLGDFQYNVMDRVKSYGAQRDPVSASSVYQFQRDDGNWVEGWFDDQWSLDRKLAFLNQQRVRGIAFFMLGYDGGLLIDHFLGRRKDPGPQVQTPF